MSTTSKNQHHGAELEAFYAASEPRAEIPSEVEGPQCVATERSANQKFSTTGPNLEEKKSYMPAGHLGTKRMGELAELAFTYRAASEGIGVARPYGDSHPYDFLVQHGRRLARVQVKSCFTTRRQGRMGFPIMARHRINRGGLAYSLDDIDFIAAYVAPHQAWYVIPIEALKGGISIRLYPQRRSKRTAGLYEGYREAWNLLKDENRAAPAEILETDKIASSGLSTQASARTDL